MLAKIIRGLFHFLLLSTPLFFTWINEELFEFNKLWLVLGLTIIITVLWITESILAKRWIFTRTPFDWFILAFLTSQLISTIFSMHPQTSLIGYYTRFHGGFISYLAYAVLFYAFVAHVTKRHLAQFAVTLLISATLVSLYAIPEHFGASPSCWLISGGSEIGTGCWIQDVKTRVFATFGQPNWLAAFLIMIIPIQLSLVAYPWDKLEKARSGRLLIAGAGILMMMALIYTRSRSGFLGLGVGILSWLAGINLVSWQKVKLSLLPALAWLAVPTSLVVILGSPYTPSLENFMRNTVSQPGVEEAPAQTVANRLDVGGTDSGEIRKIVWAGALNVW
jgi:putative inorganic carbon (hco3(-)) transporter